LVLIAIRKTTVRFQSDVGLQVDDGPTPTGRRPRCPLESSVVLGSLASGAVSPAEARRLDQTGTGKSHLAQAIGHAAIQQGYRVIYREAHTLLEELTDATSPARAKTI